MTETERTIKILSLLRKQQGVTLRKLEELTGIKNANLSFYETGQRVPTYENLVKILNALGKHFEIVDNKKQRKPKKPKEEQ